MSSLKDYAPFVPFDLYDFFGYLFPGILFATSVGIFVSQFQPSMSDLYKAFITDYNNAPFLVGFVMIVAGVVFLYVLGHFVATISHIIIDRVLLDGIEGYPINFLLQIPRETRPYSECTFKYLFATYNVLLVMPVFISDYSTLHTVLLVLLGSIAFLILQRIVIMFVRTSEEGKAVARRVGNWTVFRTFLIPSQLIVDPLIGFLRRLLGMDRRFPDSFIRLYKTLFHTRFHPLEADTAGSENYWLPAFHALAKDPSHERTLQTWLHLYGFSRNASAAFYLSSSLIIGHLLFNPESHTTFTRVQLGVTWLLAANLGLRYWILYSHYYSKGVIRAFVESATSISPSNDRQTGA
jgi:hypothetical protein